MKPMGCAILPVLLVLLVGGCVAKFDATTTLQAQGRQPSINWTVSEPCNGCVYKITDTDGQQYIIVNDFRGGVAIVRVEPRNVVR